MPRHFCGTLFERQNLPIYARGRIFIGIAAHAVRFGIVLHCIRRIIWGLLSLLCELNVMRRDEGQHNTWYSSCAEQKPRKDISHPSSSNLLRRKLGLSEGCLDL